MKVFNRRQSRRIIPWLPGIAVLLGALIYLLLRPVEPAGFDWARKTGLGPILGMIRPGHPLFHTDLPGFLVYSLPNALWAFAYTLLIFRIWGPVGHGIRYFWYITVPILVFGFELLQLPGILPGTFSIPDLVWGSLGITAGFITGIYSTKHSHHEKEFY